MWWTRTERILLSVFGGLGLLALAVLGLESARPPLTVAGLPPGAAADWDARVDRARRVDVNRASAAELERLPGIGPRLAGRIAKEREARGPFTTVDDLARVPGIGPATVRRLAPYVALTE
ncbi:MAG TPA: ComEA family DNA-binding protein [bacterium]